LQTFSPAFHPGAFHVSVFETIEQLQSLAAEWDELLVSSDANSIFLTWEWISSWFAAVTPRANLFVLTVRDPTDNRLLAVLPLYVAPMILLGCLRLRCLRMLGDCHTGAEYPDVIVRHGFEGTVLPFLAQRFNAWQNLWDCAWIPNIAGWTGAEQRITQIIGPTATLCQKRKASFSARELPSGWEEFWTSLSTGQRTLLKRQGKKIDTPRGVQIDHCTDAQNLQNDLETLFVLHRQRWESARQLGSFARRPRMVDFYKDFAPKALKNGWLALFTLSLDGRRVAAQYGYAYRQTFHQLQEGYDPTSLPGVGNKLRQEVFRWCIAENLTGYDFLGEHTDHKARWGSHERWGKHLFAWRPTLKGFLLSRLGLWPTGRFFRHGS